MLYVGWGHFRTALIPQVYFMKMRGCMLRIFVWAYTMLIWRGRPRLGYCMRISGTTFMDSFLPRSRSTPVPRTGECCWGGAADVGGSGCHAEDVPVCVKETFLWRCVPLSPSIFYVPCTYLVGYRLRTKDFVERLPHSQSLRSGVPPFFLPPSPSIQY